MLSCVWLCDPMECGLPGSSIHGILQAIILEWVAIPSSRESSGPRDWTHLSWVSCIGGWVLYHWRCLGSPRWPMKLKGKVAQSCVTLCDPMDYAVLEILQARTLEWVAFPFSRASSTPGTEPRSPTLQADSLPTGPPGTPMESGACYFSHPDAADSSGAPCRGCWTRVLCLSLPVAHPLSLFKNLFTSHLFNEGFLDLPV